MLLLVLLVILLRSDAVDLKVVSCRVRKSVAAWDMLSFAYLADSSRCRSWMVMVRLHVVVVITGAVMVGNEFLLWVVIHHIDLRKINPLLLAQQVGTWFHVSNSLHAPDYVLTNEGTWARLSNPIAQDSGLALTRAPGNLLVTILVLLVWLHLIIALEARGKRVTYRRATTIVPGIIWLSVAVLIIGNAVWEDVFVSSRIEILHAHTHTHLTLLAHVIVWLTVKAVIAVSQILRQMGMMVPTRSPVTIQNLVRNHLLILWSLLFLAHFLLLWSVFTHLMSQIRNQSAIWGTTLSVGAQIVPFCLVVLQVWVFIKHIVWFNILFFDICVALTVWI